MVSGRGNRLPLGDMVFPQIRRWNKKKSRTQQLCRRCQMTHFERVVLALKNFQRCGHTHQIQTNLALLIVVILMRGSRRWEILSGVRSAKSGWRVSVSGI